MYHDWPHEPRLISVGRVAELRVVGWRPWGAHLGAATTLAAKGRHDPCVLPRAVPMVEAMVALVLADHLLRQQGQCSVW